MAATIEDVKTFWETNPLFSGESQFEPGSKEFFEDHKQAYYEDCFAGKFNDGKFIPKDLSHATVLDLGCGVGFWSVEILQRRNPKALYAADLTQKAVDITKKRLAQNGLSAIIQTENAESLTFANNFFDHINCQGVIHHTPNTEIAIKEIARVLKPGGTASISVYYKNFFLRNWNWFSGIGELLAKLGGGLKGRGRQHIFKVKHEDDLTRLYDGANNPIGKSYSKDQMKQMISPFFEVEKMFVFFFPARALPFKIPRFLHRILSDKLGFMLHLNLRKK